MFFLKILKSKSTIIWLIVTSLLLAVMIVANVLAITMFSSLFDVIFGRPKAILGNGREQVYVRDYETKDEAREAAEEVNKRIVEEGVVLLKNEGALPLPKNSNVSVFGKNSVKLVYGGSGSGGSKHENAKTIFDALSEAGISFNTALKGFYEGGESGSGRPDDIPIENGGVKDLTTGETPQSSYTQQVKDSYTSFKDAAIVVISRIGGEGWDLPRANGHSGNNAYAAGDHYLRLDKNERELLDAVSDAGFTRIVVLINSNNPLELGVVADDDRIKGCLWIGTPGDSGIMALGSILNGDVSPSGKTADTYSRNFMNDPVWVNFGDMNKNNGEKYLEGGVAKAVSPTHVDYEEDIYVGYRYYETRGFTEKEANAASTWYEDNVVYPFGHGLSYTTFEQEFVSKPANATITKTGKLSFDVRVKNTGDTYTGKDVVQIYVTAPYTPGGIEKSYVALAAFAKTSDIAPGASVVVPIEVDPYLFASYDADGSQCFVLEENDYQIKLGKNSHTMYDSFTAKVTSKIEFKDGVSAQVANRYDDADDELGSILSRNGFEGTLPKARTDEERNLTAATKEKLSSKVTNNPLTVPMSKYPNVGEDNGLTFYDMVGVPFGDGKWDLFLDQLTVEEMTNLATDGQFKTLAITAHRIPATICADGPFGFTTFMKDAAIYGTCFYASEAVLASTWNQELSEEFGESVGNEALVGNENGDGLPYSGWYAPGVNIHRSPFGGRAGEYFSEDPLLSGKMGAAEVRGARSKGVMTFAKHFAVNEQETSRTGIATWLTESALREIYLRPFELIVKEGKTTAIMSSFNRIGTMWAGGDHRLLTKILREEWGFEGMVVCDYFVNDEIADTRQMIYAGGDLHLMASGTFWFKPKIDSATDITVLRNACKNILFAVANSNITDYDIIGYHLAGWTVVLIIVDVSIAVALSVWGFFAIRISLKKLKCTNS